MYSFYPRVYTGGIIVIAKAFGDRYEGDLLAKFLASLMVVNGIVTIIMPLLGGLSLTLGSSRIVFIILTFISLFVLLGVATMMPKTHKSEHKSLNFKDILLDFGSLMKTTIHYSDVATGVNVCNVI